MAMYRTCATFALLASWVTIISAQSVVPSNSTDDIPSYDSSPRFWVNGTGFDSFRIAPLGWYSRLSQSDFLATYIVGNLIPINVENANSFHTSALDYISCDPEDYPGILQAADVIRSAAIGQQGNSIILYSTRAQHCNTSSLREIAPVNGIFTTLDPVLAQAVLRDAQNHTNGMQAVINPDRSSYTNNTNQPGGGSYSGGNSSNGAGSTPRPTTAVAMIILYTITGLITALFMVIIVTGAVRAHRHPERYGPRSAGIAGRGGRSRAKGIARAMLDTIPIVKFGEKDETPTIAKEVDIEMDAAKSKDTPTTSSDKAIAETTTTIPLTKGAVPENDKDSTAKDTVTPTNPDGTDESGQLGCSICTEDFTKGEEVRVLPCNHKFHPECVDPWLLNVSGTCPLCRIDLRPQPIEEAEAVNDQTQNSERPNSTRRGSMFDLIAPPLGHPPVLIHPERGNLALGARERRDTADANSNLQSAVTGTREDRIAALRTYRAARLRGNDAQIQETSEQAEERRGLTARLRERFRVRTRRQGEDENVEGTGTATATGRRETLRRFSHNHALRNSYAA